MRRRAPGPAELEALDPLTGESLASSPTPTTPRNAARAAHLRTVRLVLAVLAVGCAAGAAYFGITIRQLRDIERTWRTAIAVDLARAAADNEILETLDLVGGDDEDAARAPLATIGTEAVAAIESAERHLASRRILDSKVSDLRDEMVSALEFRRFQLTPQRAQMGDTPLREVEAAIEVQLDRWGLPESEVDPPVLSSLDGVLERLRRFADRSTGEILFATTRDRVLITIDVDGNLARGRPLPRPAIRLLPAPGGAAVFDGVELTVYPADVDAAAIVRVPASRLVYETNDGTGDLWVVDAAGDAPPPAAVVRRFRPAAGESLQPPITVPPLRQVAGAAAGRLVLVDLVTGGLELWEPPAGEPVTLSAGPSRFLVGDEQRVLWQGPLPFGDRHSDGYLHLLDIAKGTRELLALPPTDAASADLAPDGTIAVAAGPFAGRLGSVLVARAGTAALAGVDGPRASVRGDALRWSRDGSELFWLTPDGRVAMRPGTGRSAVASTMRTGLEGLERLTIAGR